MVLDGNSDKCGLHTKLLSNKGVQFHYTQGSVERKRPCIAHMCVWMGRLCNGARWGGGEKTQTVCF